MDETRTTDPTAPISVTDPISRALDWTGRVLFRPFDFTKWLTLGFCAWLAWIGQAGGGGGGSNWNLPDGEDTPDLDVVRDWTAQYLTLVIVVAVVAFVLIVGFVLLLTWLSSRGKFMLLDGVVHDRGAVREPWSRFRAHGNSLFGFRVVVGLLALIPFGGVFAGLAFSIVALSPFDGEFVPGAVAILLLWILALVVIGIGFGLVAVALNDFVVPIMWLRDCRVMDAWREFLSLLAAHKGTFALYVLMKVLMALVIGTLSCVVTCLTCCLAALPYVGAVILLPLHVFRRSYSIYFLSQLGPDYVSLGPLEPAAEAPPVAEEAPEIPPE